MLRVGTKYDKVTDPYPDYIPSELLLRTIPIDK